jgi:hypothetical protein
MIVLEAHSMTSFKLTLQQKTFFDTFGFLKFPGLMNDRIEEITDEFESVFKKNGGNFNGKEHNFRKTSTIVAFLGHSEKLASLLDDPRVREITSSLLGEDYNYLTSAGNKYVGIFKSYFGLLWPKSLEPPYSLGLFVFTNRLFEQVVS